MKKRQMLLGCLLALVLSVSAVLSACSSGDNSPAGNKKSAGQIVGVWEAYDIFEPGLGNLREGAAYDDYKNSSMQFMLSALLRMELACLLALA